MLQLKRRCRSSLSAPAEAETPELLSTLRLRPYLAEPSQSLLEARSAGRLKRLTSQPQIDMIASRRTKKDRPGYRLARRHMSYDMSSSTVLE